jgi:hypothetical protein
VEPEYANMGIGAISVASAGLVYANMISGNVTVSSVVNVMTTMVTMLFVSMGDAKTTAGIVGMV